MKRSFDTAALQSLFAEISSGDRQSLERLHQRVCEAKRDIRSLRKTEASRCMLMMLECIEQAAAEHGLSYTQYPIHDVDHDYSSFLKLSRSVKFQWGPWTSMSDGNAHSPCMWALSQILADTNKGDEFSLLEVGAGTGALAYELGSVRPYAHITLSDSALEPMVLAVLIHGGHRLAFPIRVDPAQSEDGIGWYQLQVEPLKKAPVFKAVALPDIEPVNYVVAVNSLSLAPDPAAAAVQLGNMVQPGGLFIWLDLLCWRVETPPPRRLPDIGRMAACMEQAGLSVIRKASRIPMIEDWGYERSYHWLSHMVVGRKSSK